MDANQELELYGEYCNICYIKDIDAVQFTRFMQFVGKADAREIFKAIHGGE